jgi:hypothetical protein
MLLADAFNANVDDKIESARLWEAAGHLEK